MVHALTLLTEHHLLILCPLCKRGQRMRRSHDLWFPIRPFCCEAMHLLDSPEWNQLLDKAIERALDEQSTN